MSMWRLFLPLLVAACLGGGCGQQGVVECSGGTASGNTCIPDPGVHWTDAKASARVLGLDYRPTVSGRFTEARCRIVARYPFYEAKAVCTGVFAAPGEASRSVVATFGLSGHGVVIPDCSARWRSNPLCTQKSEVPPVPG